MLLPNLKKKLVNHHGVKPIIVDFLYNKQNLFRQSRFCCYFWSYSCIVVLYFLTNSDQAVYSRSFFLFCSFAICYSLLLSSHKDIGSHPLPLTTTASGECARCDDQFVEEFRLSMRGSANTPLHSAILDSLHRCIPATHLSSVILLLYR